MKYFHICSIIFSFIFCTNIFGQSITLPVELVYFTYKIVDTYVLLNWRTATEVNNYGFNVERYSDSTWKVITFVPGNGTSNSPIDYSYEDTTAEAGKTYLYRLQQIDNIGDYKYSDTLIVSVVSGIKKNKITVPGSYLVSQNYPNPFNPSTNIKINLPESNKLIFKVYDGLGRLVFEKDYGYKSPGMHTINFYDSNLSSGVYYYSVIAGDNIQTKKMLLLK